MNFGISKKLDYNLYSNTERTESVCEMFNEELTSELELHYTEASTQKELEAAANFILYGKDVSTGKNFIQKKEMSIDPKYSSYKRKEPESLEGILENPAHNELEFKPLVKNSYTKPKPKIDRELDKGIAGMQDLWDAIDMLAPQVSKLKLEGKLRPRILQKESLAYST